MAEFVGGLCVACTTANAMDHHDGDCDCWCHEPDEDSDEARDARSEQAHESRYGLHRDGTADND